VANPRSPSKNSSTLMGRYIPSNVAPLLPRKDFALGKLNGKNPATAKARLYSFDRSELIIVVEHASPSIPSIMLIALSIDMNQNNSITLPNVLFNVIPKKVIF